MISAFFFNRVRTSIHVLVVNACPQEPLSLCLAVQSGDIEAVRKILSEYESENSAGEREKLIDQRNQDSHAPLHLACTTGNM